MARLLSTIVSFIALLLISSVACANWEEWAAGNGGVHARPVTRIQPEVSWTFSHPTGPADEGVIVIRSSDNNIFFTNGNSYEPLFWMLSPDGTELFSWNDTNSADGYCDGSLTEKNGIVYVFNDGACALSAVDLSDGSLLWQLNQADLCGDFVRNSASAFMWEGDTHFYFSSWSTTHKIQAATGTIQWSAPSGSDAQSYFLHPIRAYDDNLVLHSGNNDLYKLNKNDGTVMWTINLGAAENSPNAQPAPTVDHSNGNIYVADTSGIVAAFDNDGNELWSQIVEGARFRPGSPVLINSDYFLLGDDQSGHIYRFATADGSMVVAFDNSADKITYGSGIKSQMIWSDNVLYAVHYTSARLGAYDTTNSSALELLWSMALPTLSHWGGGPSIDSNGNIYLSSDEYSSDAPGLVAIAPVYVPVESPVSAPVSSPVSVPVNGPSKAPGTKTSSAAVLASSAAVIATSLIVAAM